MRFLHFVTPAVLTAACAGGPTEPPTPTRVYDVFWREYDRHYAFFLEKSIDWTALRAATESRVTDDTDAGELRAVLCELVNALRDRHAALGTPDGTCSWTGGPAYEHHFVAATVLEGASYLDGGGRTTASGRIVYGLIGDVGYVRIADFSGDGWGPEIEVALRAFGEPRGVVIDVRDNGGGNEANAVEVAGRFADAVRPAIVARFRDGAGHDDFGAPMTRSVRPLGSEHFAGPVAVLTNRYSASATENFVMYMRVLPAVVTIGDTTAGTASNPLRRTLPNGWTVWIPRSIESTPEGLVVEGHGLPPAVVVHFADGDAAAGVDPVLDAALARLGR